MVRTIGPHGSEEYVSLLGTITALEATVMVLLGYVAARGAGTIEEAHATLAELRAHCHQVRETLLSMVAHGDRVDADDLDDAFTSELDRIFAAVQFNVNKPQ